jgi:hypothetical protein
MTQLLHHVPNTIIQLFDALILQMPAAPEITAPGFLGYAVDFMQLRPCMEHLRPALRSKALYNDMSVWSTAAEALAHQAIVQSPLHFVALDSIKEYDCVSISSWRFRPARTAEALRAAVVRCRAALNAAEQRVCARALQHSACDSDSESGSESDNAADS